MIQILLVDDDVLAMDGIIQNIDWNALGIGEIHRVYSAAEARSLMREYTILLTDIEMPEQSGLELAQWVKDHFRYAVSIFLTSFADFKYTTHALRLGGIDYMLKPVAYSELEDALRRAVASLNQISQQDLHKKYAGYWNDSVPTVSDRFWRDVVFGIIKPEHDSIARAAAKRHILYSGVPLRPVAFELPESALSRWERDLADVAIRNILNEVFACDDDQLPIILQAKNWCYVVLCSSITGRGEICQQCTHVLQLFESLFESVVMCRVAAISPVEALHSVVHSLVYSPEDELPAGCVCLFSSHVDELHAKLNQWCDALSPGNYTEVIADVQAYLRSKHPTLKQLALIYKGLSGKIYRLFSEKGIQPIPLLADERTAELSSQAAQSSDNLMKWLEHMLQRLIENGIEPKDATIQRIQEYIEAHLSEDISRHTIAANLYLSVDYISHLFKNKTGQSLSDYIIAQRMERAQKLLSTTKAPIHQIASDVGYNNFPYFSKIFKRESGMTPEKYRKAHKKGK